VSQHADDERVRLLQVHPLLQRALRCHLHPHKKERKEIRQKTSKMLETELWRTNSAFCVTMPRISSSGWLSFIRDIRCWGEVHAASPAASVESHALRVALLNMVPLGDIICTGHTQDRSAISDTSPTKF
jgi:hypothetical protein